MPAIRPSALGTQVSGENTSDIRTLRIYFSFIRVFGYGESIGTIFVVPRIEVKQFRRHLMMTSAKIIY